MKSDMQFIVCDKRSSRTVYMWKDQSRTRCVGMATKLIEQVKRTGLKQKSM